MQRSHSKLPFFGIIKLIVHVPRGLCLDKDFCCEIVPSLSLGHYLAQHQSLIKTVPSGNIHYYTNSACSRGDYARIGTDAVARAVARALFHSSSPYHALLVLLHRIIDEKWAQSLEHQLLSQTVQVNVDITLF